VSDCPAGHANGGLQEVQPIRRFEYRRRAASLADHRQKSRRKRSAFAVGDPALAPIPPSRMRLQWRNPLRDGPYGTSALPPRTAVRENCGKTGNPSRFSSALTEEELARRPSAESEPLRWPCFLLRCCGAVLAGAAWAPGSARGTAGLLAICAEKLASLRTNAGERFERRLSREQGGTADGRAIQRSCGMAREADVSVAAKTRADLGAWHEDTGSPLAAASGGFIREGGTDPSHLRPMGSIRAIAAAAARRRSGTLGGTRLARRCGKPSIARTGCGSGSPLLQSPEKKKKKKKKHKKKTTKNKKKKKPGDLWLGLGAHGTKAAPRLCARDSPSLRLPVTEEDLSECGPLLGMRFRFRPGGQVRVAGKRPWMGCILLSVDS